LDEIAGRESRRAKLIVPLATIGHVTQLASDVFAKVTLKMQREISGGIRYARSGPPKRGCVGESFELLNESGYVALKQRSEFVC
jgi:hypothetical protein